MKSLTVKLMIAITVLSGIFMFSPPAMALDCSNPASAKEQIQCGACGASGSATCDPATAPSTISDTIKSIINVLSAIAGAAAVIMIIVGGFRYVTSAGNAESTKSARNTLIYAVVGLVIIAMAQIVVHFVLNTTNNSDCVNGKTSSGQKC